MKWLFFSYSLPAYPSKARVYIWRRLQKLGAINYQSIWVLPHSNARIEEIKRLTEEIERYNGECIVIEGKTLDRKQDERVNKAFTASRNEEYQEVIEKCDDYFKEIAFEIERKNFNFAEVEENEEELEKLKHWLNKVEKRDLVGAPLRQTALEKIKACEKMFDDFSKTVYLHMHHRGKPKQTEASKIKNRPGEKRK